MNILNHKGLSLVEVMVTTLLMASLFGGGYLLLSTGQATWFTTDVQIQLQENLRKSIERLLVELRQTNSGQSQIFDGIGPGSSDSIRFSIPVVCHAGDNLINSSGDVAYWRAPLTWGCTSATCMDADDVCATVDYKSIEYKLDDSNDLIRQVLNDFGTVVRTDTFAKNISDFQVTASGKILTLTVTAQKSTVFKRSLSSQLTVQVYLRN